jgi:hypothetical protein
VIGAGSVHGFAGGFLAARACNLVFFKVSVVSFPLDIFAATGSGLLPVNARSEMWL